MISSDIIQQYFTVTSFKRNEFLTREGDTEHKLYYIKNGIVRWLAYDQQGNEHTSDFAFANDFANSYQSFKNQTPSTISLQALSNVDCCQIEREKFYGVIHGRPELTLVFIDIIDNLFIRTINRGISLIKNTPQENYLDLLRIEPDLIKNVPLQYIASYIGITPQALSRIRRRIS